MVQDQINGIGHPPRGGENEKDEQEENNICHRRHTELGIDTVIIS